MKVVILSSSDSSGGAAIASYRLHNALIKAGVGSNMLVRHKCKPDLSIHSIHQPSYFVSKEIYPGFALEKFLFLPYEKSKEYRFIFSTNQFGFPVYKHSLIQDADIIHLHWINNAYISLKGLEKLLSLGKPIVWTLHDMWPFTGGCHYAGNCLNYLSGCGSCPMLNKPSSNDLSVKIFNRKEEIYRNKNLTVVTCSKWLAELAKGSSLFSNFKVFSIPNPIDQSVYYPIDKLEAREVLGLNIDKIYLLFVAGNIFDERKGIKYLVEALGILSESQETIKNLELLVIGKSNHNLSDLFQVPVNYFGQISGNDKIHKIYCAADAFLLPSLQDNLPNTIMESLACGTPVIAFETGGVPEMIEHKKTGFLAKEKSSESLAEGIKWLIETSDTHFQNTCIKFVTNHYSEKIVAEKYLQLYQSLTKNGR
jgi:glycosyltransferase involved in cell wall biosynthesis